MTKPTKLVASFDTPYSLKMAKRGSNVSTIFLVFLFYVVTTVAQTRQYDMAVKRSKPGIKAPKKVWWAKEITQDFHVAGRLTERQIKYASEAGFRSILSLFMYETDDVGNFGGERLPTSAEAWATAHMSGMQYVALIGGNDDWGSVDTILKFSDVLPKLRRPILLHCDRGYTITFVTLMHMANQTRYNSSFEPKIYSEDFYRITAAMGLNFLHDDLKEVVANITGEDIVEDPPAPNCTPTEWLDFWLAHPVTKHIYTAGQLRQCDVRVLEATGFKAIVNMRYGVTHKGKPSQESVTLLNVNDNTTTYGNTTVPPRQDINLLESNLINPHHSSDYISEKSKINYEIENPSEFGDDIGYNEELEKKFIMTNSSLKYYHVPVSVDTSSYSQELFEEVHKILLEAGKDGPVLLHCSVGKRVAILGVLSAAVQENLGLDWALRKLQDLGYEAGPQSNPEVYRMYCQSLGQETRLGKEEL